MREPLHSRGSSTISLMASACAGPHLAGALLTNGIPHLCNLGTAGAWALHEAAVPREHLSRAVPCQVIEALQQGRELCKRALQPVYACLEGCLQRRALSG